VEIHGLGETAPLVEQAVPHRRRLEKAPAFHNLDVVDDRE
jgi:hypothetical protein